MKKELTKDQMKELKSNLELAAKQFARYFKEITDQGYEVHFGGSNQSWSFVDDLEPNITLRKTEVIEL